MEILISSEVEEKIVEELSKTSKDINIVSAFCKKSTLSLIDKNVNGDVKKRLLVRFLPSDISSGATDKEIFSYCKENGWQLFFDYTLHAKTYVFDHVKCILGSANLTNKGIGIASNCNKEASAYFLLDDDSYKKIMSLYKDSLLMTDELYEMVISGISDEEFISKREKTTLNVPKITCLFPEDFPDENTDVIELYQCRSYKWLVSFLKSKENKTSYFGEITANIHNAFVKDPRPYRKDIKQHLVDLLSCIKRLNISEIEITRPNHSEVVKLLG